MARCVRSYAFTPITILPGTTLLGTSTSNTPVPVRLSLPTTIFPEGDVRSSKSPCKVASERNAAVVSNDAFRRGEELVAIPERLNGL